MPTIVAIQQLSSTGKHITTVGACGNGPLQFQSPVSIAVHLQTHKVYVVEWWNHGFEALNSDHRIQVFTANRIYLRQCVCACCVTCASTSVRASE